MSPGQETPAVLIPKYSMIGPFKGHRSMKSTPLFPGSSCSLSTQFLLQDHMAAHYRNLHSAKATVDTSAPKSLSSSVKYRDQQNKEKLLQAIERFKKELQHIHPTARHRVQSNFLEQDRVHLGDREFQMSLMSQYFNVYKESSPVLSARDILQGNEKGTYHYNNVTTSRRQSLPKKKPYNDPQKQTYSGDLLDKHADSFTSVKKPFKPRLLKKSAGSFLSKYRYYKAPAKSDKKSPQTDKGGMSNFTEVYRFLEDSYEPLENRTQNHGTYSRLPKQEDDLKCLNFLKELTDDILLRGGGSSSAIDRVFQDHLQRKNHNIPEVTKKILVQDLKEELQQPDKLDFSISYIGTLYSSGNIPLQGRLSHLLHT
ncbi:spermatogenesis-associated protein 7 homolog [Rana temporaria]|uniref:spermatogenesis-associated protein 7 homolog n=1 Tax=Rana temporaria TaxID=8407 RepID=UPI001AAD9CCD|nr:spermatogenesis-associated protein 7 homolog [Rana temporaria]